MTDRWDEFSRLGRRSAQSAGAGDRLGRRAQTMPIFRQVWQQTAVDRLDVTLPAPQLIGFACVDLEPGASKKVEFVVPMSLRAYTGISGELVMETGPVELNAGSSSSDIRSSAKLIVTGKTRAIRGGERAFLSVATVGP